MVHEVVSAGFADATIYEAGHLGVSAEKAQDLLRDPALGSIRLSWASPGQSVRIVKVLDAVEPRSKGAGGAGVFPGFLAPALPQGRGQTHVLAGAAVVAAGYLPRAQEAVVDMSGPGAALSPLGGTHNLVVEFEPTSGAPWEQVESALRRGLLRLAAHMAEAALATAPDRVDELLPPLSSDADGLPSIGAITNLQTQGAFKDVFVYGRSFGGSLPTLIDPNELEDGAVVSGQYGHPALKNPTYLLQNHPVVAALRAENGLHFAGLIISPEPVEQAQKELVSAHAARLCRALGWDAAVVTKEGGGNADADVALKMDALEEAGIVSVGLFSEMAGADGTAPSLVAPPAKAKTIVSTGNYDERLRLPAVERTLGGEMFDLLDVPATGELEVPVAVLYCSLSPLGWGRLTARPRLGALQEGSP